MLLINLNPILYNLKDFRAYVLKTSTAKSNIVLLANNKIVFNLTKKELNNIKKVNQINQYASIISSYNKINYIDDQYQHLVKQYPFLKILNTMSTKTFEQIFKLLSNNVNTFNKLTSIILSRKKTLFKIRVLGIFGHVSVFSALTSFANLWTKKKIIDYKTFIKVLLSWLRTSLILNVNSIFIKLYFEKKILKKEKLSKNFNRKRTIQKSLIIFSNENITI